mgnify:CR=1 FL=1
MTPVKVWQERVEIPTYETGPQDIHPMFLENRVYQGSSGAVYPYGVTDTLSEQKTLKSWQAVWLENDYIKVMILPELGGRVHRAWDKVKQRDFVYHNEVIKPALVGLLGTGSGITTAEKQALLTVLRMLAAGNDAAMDACDRLATLWDNPQPPKENVFAVLGQAILGKMILGRNK